MKLVVFLLLVVGGAAINVAVAWGCAVRGHARAKLSGICRSLQGHHFYLVERFECFGYCLIEVLGGDKLEGGELDRASHPAPTRLTISLDSFPAWSNARSSESWPKEVEGWSSRDEASGWPLLSMNCRVLQRGSMLLPSPPRSKTIEHGILFGTESHPRGSLPPSLVPLVVPLHVLWPGFAINTVFYAGVCWLLFAAPFAVRRRRRIKRGLCPACAYPVGGSAVCTECGTPRPVAAPRPLTPKNVDPPT